jgi:hypothetical protein
MPTIAKITLIFVVFVAALLSLGFIARSWNQPDIWRMTRKPLVRTSAAEST